MWPFCEQKCLRLALPSNLFVVNLESHHCQSVPCMLPSIYSCCLQTSSPGILLRLMRTSFLPLLRTTLLSNTNEQLFSPPDMLTPWTFKLWHIFESLASNVPLSQSIISLSLSLSLSPSLSQWISKYLSLQVCILSKTFSVYLNFYLCICLFPTPSIPFLCILLCLSLYSLLFSLYTHTCIQKCSHVSINKE